MITPRGILSFAALGAAAAFSFWVLQVGAPVAAPRGAPRHVPDYHFTTPRITRFGADGALDLDLTATRAVHFPDDDSVALDDLHIDLRDESGAEWRMRAAHGSASMSADTVLLEGAVRIVRPAADHALELRTERVMLDTRARTLDTELPVALEDRASHIDAVGLHADLGTQRLVFRERVRGSYVTP